MKLREDHFVANDLREVSGSDLASPSRLTVWIHRSAGKEGRDGSIISPTDLVRTLTLLLTALFLFLIPFRRADNPGGNAPKRAPDNGRRAESSPRVFASQSDKGVTAPLSTRHGVRKTEYVSNGIPGVRVTETQRAGGESSRQKLAAQRSDGGSSQKSIVRGIRRTAKREVGEDMRVT